MHTVNCTVLCEELTTNESDSIENLYKLPIYMQIVSMIICILIIVVGVTGNLMVLTVIIRGKDMKSSTHIFLMNLSIADLCVLLICTPAILVEVNAGPRIWVLGENMCKAVPFIESTVAHASVLTILAISFERYYAICKPLRATYICTKSRAALVCILTWFIAGVCTSPFLFMVKFEIEEDEFIPVCTTEARAKWSIFYISTTIAVFFIIPVIILVTLYSLIVYQLVQRSNISCEQAKTSQQNRNQVVRMLCTVTFVFFICLLPFRAMIIWVMSSSLQEIVDLGVEGYFGLLYFSRIMFYLNSALNPILYTLMSMKFKKSILNLLNRWL